MLAWATVKVTVTGAASTRTVVLAGSGRLRAGMVRVSVVVGMNGAVAIEGPGRSVRTSRQLPVTGGENVGVTYRGETGAERLTVTTWSDGTWVAPWAGVVEATVNGVTGSGGVVAAPARFGRGPGRVGMATDDEGTNSHGDHHDGHADGDQRPTVAPGRGYEDRVVGHGSSRSGPRRYLRPTSMRSRLHWRLMGGSP